MCNPQQKRLLEEKIYTLESELEEFRWKQTGSEIEKIELINGREQASREAILLKQQLQ